MITLSIILPTLNEEENLNILIPDLIKNLEIIDNLNLKLLF